MRHINSNEPNNVMLYVSVSTEAEMSLPTKFDNLLSTLTVDNLKSLSIDQVSNSDELLKFIQQNWDRFECDKISSEHFTRGITVLQNGKQEQITIAKNNENDEFVPMVYDLLLKVFNNTDTKEREKYFFPILDEYYKKLSGRKSSELLSKDKFIKDVYKFLPYVKLDILKSAAKKNDINAAKQIVQEVFECIAYPNFLREHCYSVLYKLSNEVVYDFEEFKLLPIVDSSGTLGEYYRLKLSVRDGKTSKTLNLFVKYLPTSNSSCNEDQIELAKKSFIKEEFFYDVFISSLEKLGCKDITDFAAKLYLVIKDEALVFEDLSVSGYEMSDIRKPATKQWLESCMRNLAKLHACTFIFEEKRSASDGKQYRIGEEYEQCLEETLMNDDNELYCNSGRTVVNGMIDKFPDIPKIISIEEFKKRAKLKFDLERKMVKKSSKYRNVVCHGDMWASNILINENPQTNDVSSLLIDFQLLKYCPPTFDILEIIYTNTSKEIRDAHMDKLLKLYYTNLTEILSKHGVDISKVFDEDTFNKCCKDMRSTAICSALHFVQIFVPPDHYTYMQSTDQDKKTEFFTGDRFKFLEEALEEEPFRSRIRDLLEDLYNECLDE